MNDIRQSVSELMKELAELRAAQRMVETQKQVLFQILLAISITTLSKACSSEEIEALREAVIVRLAEGGIPDTMDSVGTCFNAAKAIHLAEIGVGTIEENEDATARQEPPPEDAEDIPVDTTADPEAETEEASPDDPMHE